MIHFRIIGYHGMTSQTKLWLEVTVTHNTKENHGPLITPVN